MKNWTKYLSDEVYNRLANCKTIKKDLPELVNTKWRMYKELGKDSQGHTKEDALIAVLELLDCNGIVFDLTVEEYSELCF